MKKLLFAAMSLAAFAACTSDDFESQKVAEETSPVKFEVLNFNDATTRASMEGNTIVWNANDGDLFTLYHGAANLGDLTGYENATYKANANEGGTATLSTPTMIKKGAAIMVWPVDSDFRIKPADNLTIKIPAVQNPSKKHGDIAEIIPYVSDQIDIAAYNDKAPYNTAGLNRAYPVTMRPMASQLNIKADYAKTDDKIAELYEGGSACPADGGIDPISVTSVDLLTQASGTTQFTTEIPVKFTDPTPAIEAQWATVANNAWKKVTDFNIPGITGQTDKLTTTCLTGNEGCKFLILPQAEMATLGAGVVNGGVVVNTIYGKVVIAKAGLYDSEYSVDEYADSWYRFVKETTAAEDGETKAATKETEGPGAGKYKTTANIEMGLKQTINGFSAYKAENGTIKGEPVGAAATRYVKVLLNHLDMSGLHIKTDKQLRDAALVWKHLGLKNVTVFLDGDDNKEFKISQKTIAIINEIDKTALKFQVKPCVDAGEACETIVITGSSDIQKVQDIAFITDNAGTKAYVALADEGTAKPWIWDGAVKVAAAGVAGIINNGVMQNAETKTLKTVEFDNTPNNVELANNGTWNITAGTVNVQFTVWNLGKVNIAKGAQYREDGADHFFYNYAAALPTRFGGDDNKIGKVENKGVFATVDDGEIWNIGLIEHADKDAKTYITKNQWGTKYTNPTFAEAFAYDENHVEGNANMIGRINLPYSNKNEDNVSVSAALEQGFVSVTVDGEVTGALDASVVGNKVNYVIVNSGVTEIKAVSAQVKYLEINMTDNSEIAWNVNTPTTYKGLIVLSPVNIKLGTTITADVTYLGADMYVGGTFNKGGTDWNGYYGNTAGNVATKYITY